MEADRHLVYILKCRDDTLYTGYTNNLENRLKMHSEGKGAKYTRGRGPFELVYTAYFATKEEAMQREYEIKRLPRKMKNKLIAESDVLMHENAEKL